MNDETAITIYQGIDQAPVTSSGVLRSYDDSMAQAGMVADRLSQEDTFKVYHQTLTANSREAQLDALQLFSTFLAEAGVSRSAADLYRDAQAWRGMSEGLAKGFRQWLVNAGYRIGSINHRLAIVRQYCRLAHKAGVIADDTYELILTVKGYSAKVGRNIDQDRSREGTPTTLSSKKSLPALVLTGQAQQLKTETTHPAKPWTRDHDKLLEVRDALLMGLLIEHAFRVSEVVALNIESFNLRKGLLTVYRSKTNDTQQHKLKKHTRLAAERYLALLALERKAGPLFTGYQGRRITRQGIFDRVRLLGQQVGIANLSPHDLRHYWTYDALENGTPLDRVQSGGNWTTATMVLRYAKRHGIANEGVIITE
jgi:integrase